MILYHIQRRTTFSRTHLDEWSARQRVLRLTTDIHVSAGIRNHSLSSQAAADYALDHATTGTVSFCTSLSSSSSSSSSSSLSSSYHGVGPLVDPVLLLQNTSLRQRIQGDRMLGTVASVVSVGCKIGSVISASFFFFFLQNILWIIFPIYFSVSLEYLCAFFRMGSDLGDRQSVRWQRAGWYSVEHNHPAFH